MLLLFAFSITPKLVLHVFFAGHTDQAAAKKDGCAFEFNKAGFNCDKDGSVATSPFVADEPVTLFYTFIPFSKYIPAPVRLSSAAKIFFPLRGPPAEIVC